MDNYLEIAIKAAIEAGNSIMKIYESEDFEIERKDDDSPLTKADLNANEVINSYLVNTGIPIISEENRQTDFFKRQNWDTCWIVDPLDGTKEFIKRNGEFTVNIALIKNSLPVAGVIYVPAKMILYYADYKDAWKRNIHDKDFEKFDHSISEKISPEKSTGKIRVVGSRSHMNHETESFIKNIEGKRGEPAEVVSRGSSLKFCLVAEGAADVYPRFAPTMEWDTAAGHAICRAVGLTVIDRQTNKEMVYNKENLLNNHFLVSAIGSDL